MTTELLLSETTNDLTITQGDIILSTTNQESLRQRIFITLSTWLGEWKLNINFGMPYRQSIFVTGINKDSVDAIFINQIRAFSDVTQILDFKSELNKATRAYTITELVVLTTEGTTENLTRFNPDDNEYVSGSIDPVGVVCDVVVSIDSANEFHQFLHFDLVGLIG